jgi:hypothetical protein
MKPGQLLRGITPLKRSSSRSVFASLIVESISPREADVQTNGSTRTLLELLGLSPVLGKEADG